MVPSREPLGRFCDVGCCWCFCFTSLELFHSLLFNVIPHPTKSYFQDYSCRHLPILYFEPSSSQSDLQHFHVDFSELFIVPWVLRFWSCILPTAAFYLAFLPHIWDTCDSDASWNIPSRMFVYVCFHRDASLSLSACWTF